MVREFFWQLHDDHNNQQVLLVSLRACEISFLSSLSPPFVPGIAVAPEVAETQRTTGVIIARTIPPLSNPIHDTVDVLAA